VKSAINAFDFLIHVAIREKDLSKAEDKQIVTNQLVPLLNKIENQVIADHFVKKVAKKLQADPQIIAKEMSRQQKKQQLASFSKPTTQPVKAAKSRSQLLSEEILSLVIHNLKQVDWQLIPLKDFPQSSQKQILQLLKKQLPKDVVMFAKKLPAELQSSFDQAFLQDDKSLTVKALGKQLQTSSLQLAKLHLRDRLRNLRSQLKSSDDKNKVTKQITDVMKKLQEYNKRD